MIEPADAVELRRGAGLTQGECAERMGICQAYLCDLEKGNREWNAKLFEKLKKSVK